MSHSPITTDEQACGQPTIRRISKTVSSCPGQAENLSPGSKAALENGDIADGSSSPAASPFAPKEMETAVASQSPNASPSPRSADEPWAPATPERSDAAALETASPERTAREPANIVAVSQTGTLL